MIKNPPQLAADPIRAGVNPRYSPWYPSCWITPLTVEHIVLGYLVVVLFVAADDCMDAHIWDDLLSILWRLLFRSSTCIRTFTKSRGYSSIVEDAPPAIPARKDDFGSIGFLWWVLCGGGGGGCCCCWVEEDDAIPADGDDDATLGVGIIDAVAQRSLIGPPYHHLLLRSSPLSCAEVLGWKRK